MDKSVGPGRRWYIAVVKLDKVPSIEEREEERERERERERN